MGSCFSQPEKDAGSGTSAQQPPSASQPDASSHANASTQTEVQNRGPPPEYASRPQQSTSSLRLTFCRYQSGALIREERPLSHDFIAISHVWGDASWRHVDGIEDQILVSDDKALFIAKSLPVIVGQSWFWMDILCIDQRDEDARVAVTAHIPSIFRAANKTVAIQESTGFRGCCIKAAGPPREFHGKTRYGRVPNDQDENIDFTEGMDGRQKLNRHLEQEHKDDCIDDGILSRLWPLQEIMLSNRIRFVRCEAAAPGSQPKSMNMNGRKRTGQAVGLVSSLGSLASAWSTYMMKGDYHMIYRLGTDRWNFIQAYFELGEVVRSVRDVAEVPEVPRARDLHIHLTSTRHTTKSIDFILAVMPQYSFYKLPHNAKRMSFSDLFLDCCRQLRDKDTAIASLFAVSRNALDGDVNRRNVVIPEPVTLGDFTKLFMGPVHRAARGSQVELLTLDRPPHTTENVKRAARASLAVNTPYPQPLEIESAYLVFMMHIIVISIMASKILWLTATNELLHELVTLPENSDRRRVIRGFLAILRNIDWEKSSTENADRIAYIPSVKSELLGVPCEKLGLMMAMMSCGVPLSAFDWAEKNLEVLYVLVAGKSFCALAPKAVVKPDTTFLMRQVGEFPMGRDGPTPRLGLLAMHERDEDENLLTTCLFPPDVPMVG
ncbi:hypothetical protein OQA88_6999 [Cercophora sp. LCS_1]